MKLTHYSNVEGLKVLDPKAHGSGLLGAEAKRKRDYPELYVNRIYFGLKGYVKELGDIRYTVSVDAESLYDLARDPKRLAPSSAELEKAGFAPFDLSASLCLFERKIRDAGFEGYLVKGSKVAVKFTPTKLWTPSKN